MGETRILVLQIEEESPIGLLGEPAAKHEAVLETVLAGEGDRLPADEEGFDGLIVLGGSMSAEEDAAYDPALPRRFAAEAKAYGRQARAFASVAGEGWFAMAAGRRKPSHEPAPRARC